MGFIDHEGIPLAANPTLAPLNTRCAQAVRRALAEADASQRENATDPIRRLSAYPDPMQSVSVEARPHGSLDVRVVYFILASRPAAPQNIARLVRALRDPSHLFLIHVDLKAGPTVVEQLTKLSDGFPNIHVLKTRRLVQWGGFSMLSAFFDAIASFYRRLDYDFLINLSDADLSLRTAEELSAFLRKFKGRVFMRVDPHTAGEEDGGGGIVRRHAYLGDALPKTPVVECGGFGFVSVNTSFNDSAFRAAADVGRPCCIGQSGPILHANLSWEAPKPPEGAHGEYRGSSWSILPADFVRYLVEDETAIQWAQYFERRLLSDELYLPTTLMHSPYRHQLVNHNLRFEAWPAGNATARAGYWDGSPPEEWGGAMALDEGRLRKAMRSAMLFAKKAVPAADATVYPIYDAWIRRKLAGDADPRQPPIAAPLLRIDPELYGLGAKRRSAAGEALEDLPPPRRVVARRRVTSLVFADGSTCSCALDCTPSRSEAFNEDEAAPTAPAAAEAEDPSAAIPENVCCGDSKDGRAALCSGAKHAPAAAANGTQRGGEVGAVVEEEEAHDEWPALISRPPPPLKPCPTARFQLASTGVGEPVVALFINRAPYPIHVYHVDARGLEVPTLSLRVGEHVEIEGLSSYAWRARTHSGILLLELDWTPPPVNDVVSIHILACDAAA